MHLLSRVIPHKVNSVKKLNKIIADGYYSFELDLIFKEENRGYFVIGRDENIKSAYKLNDFLKILPPNKVEKLWFDIKNLQHHMVENVIQQLIQLDNQFQLKNKIIFESPITSDAFAKISAVSFHTSYYLPNQLIHLMNELIDEKLQSKATEIARQIETQQVTAISFDFRIYPFVKKYLEQHIPPSIVYHTWDLSLSLIEPTFIHKLLQTNYYNDPRIKTILVNYSE